jgi:hypothetical protein
MKLCFMLAYHYPEISINDEIISPLYHALAPLSSSMRHSLVSGLAI